MAQRHRGGDAGFARKDDAAELRGEVAEIKEIDLKAGFFFHEFAGERGKAEGFRHFARAGFVGPGRAADEEDAGRPGGIFELLSRVEDSFAGFEPFEGEVELRMGKLRAGLASPRTFPVIVVRVPRDLGQAIDLVSLRIEGRIVEAFFPAALEFFLAQPGRALARADLGIKEAHNTLGRGNLARRQRGCRKFLFSFRGVEPPWTGRGSFHKANGGDEGVENAWVLPGAGSIAQGLVKGVRVPANQVLRLFDPDRSQIAGDRCANVGDCFEDYGQSRMGRLASDWPRRAASFSGQA